MKLTWLSFLVCLYFAFPLSLKKVSDILFPWNVDYYLEFYGKFTICQTEDPETDPLLVYLAKKGTQNAKQFQ